MDSDSSAGDDDDLDLVDASPSPSSSPSSLYSPGDPFDIDGEEYPQPEPTDRLSTLPNPTLIQIISLLPTKDALKTSVLSKHFQSLYSLSPTLSFYAPDPEKPRVNILSFINSVDQTLVLHNSPKLKKFHLEFEYDDVARPSVDRWLSFAVKREVEEVALDFLGNRAICEFDGKLYELPVSLRDCSCLVKLSLSCLKFGNSGTGIRWNSLKCLSVGYMMLDEGLISDVLSSCPVLEDLELRECSGFNRLHISSYVSLKRLRIYGYGDFCKETMDLEIYAPKIRSFGIYGSFRRKIRLLDVIALVDVSLNCRFLLEGNKADRENYGELMVRLLVHVRYAKYLTLGNWCIQVVSNISLGLLRFAAECLTLETCFDKWEIPGIRHMVEISDYLEKLVLNIQHYSASQSYSRNASGSDTSEADDGWDLQNVGRFKCLQTSLRSIHINGFTGSQSEFSFAEFVLSHGLCMEEMVLHCGKTEPLKRGIKYLEEGELLEVVRKLLSFKRASQHAVVLCS